MSPWIGIASSTINISIITTTALTAIARGLSFGMKRNAKKRMDKIQKKRKLISIKKKTSTKQEVQSELELKPKGPSNV